jgi:hypothetical protein
MTQNATVFKVETTNSVPNQNITNCRIARMIDTRTIHRQFRIDYLPVRMHVAIDGHAKDVNLDKQLYLLNECDRDELIVSSPPGLCDRGVNKIHVPSVSTARAIELAHVHSILRTKPSSECLETRVKWAGPFTSSKP